MDILLGKKKVGSHIEEQLRQTNRQIEYLKRENADLRGKLDDNYQTTLTSKRIIDELVKLVSLHQTKAAAIESRLAEVESTLRDHGRSLETIISPTDKEVLIFADSLSASRFPSFNCSVKWTSRNTELITLASKYTRLQAASHLSASVGVISQKRLSKAASLLPRRLLKNQSEIFPNQIALPQSLLFKKGLVQVVPVKRARRLPKQQPQCECTRLQVGRAASPFSL